MMCDQGLTQNPYSSLRSKRFCWLFCTFEAFFALWPIENWGKAEKQKCFEGEKKPTQTLATQAILIPTYSRSN